MSLPTALRIAAGEHDRVDCPIRVVCPPGTVDTVGWLVDDAAGTHIPAQVVDGELWTVLDRIPRGTTRSFHLVPAELGSAGLEVVEGTDAIAMSIDGAPFTTYRYGASEVRPYFYPLLGPTGVAMTRSYPMRTDVDGESTDHPHHRSLYVAFGEVNEVDVWAEPPHPNTGRIVHQRWNGIKAGRVVVSFDESLLWVDGQGNRLLEENRRIHSYWTTQTRLLDIDITLAPARGSVLFGDTKEGGPLAIRVASPLEGARGGTIENAYGGRRESETWGKRAPWVDYSGAVAGERVGVTLFDHPTSFRHPTWWHVREYGLFAANPFGVSAFTNDPRRRGDYVLEPGQSITFRYRVCLHLGDASVGAVADAYHNYANPPATAWE